MRVPVPTRYNLTDDKNETVVVYNDGRQEKLLPSVPGVRPDNIMLYQEFTLAEDHDSTNKITLDIKSGKNWLILLVCLSPMTTPDEAHNLVPWYAMETHHVNIGRYGRFLNTAGSMVGMANYGNFFDYTTNEKVSFPYGSAYHLIAGQKYAFYQIRLASVNKG